MQRYFADINASKIILSKDDEHHVTHVMRNKVGDKIEVVSNGTLYLGEIKSFSPLNIEVIEKIESKSNSKNMTLFFALAKGEKIDLVIQKATELGVKNIVLIETKRCVVKYEKGDFERKLVRYNKIAKEACEQSRRLDLPNIYGVYKINEIPKELLTGNLYVAYEKEAGKTGSFYDELINLTCDSSVAVAIGPEGGFELDEVAALNSLGFKNVSLGNRILRTETAAIYALSVVGFILER